MQRESNPIRNAFAGRTVALLFAFVLGFWLLLESNLLLEALYAPLYPFWLPSYLAVAFASGLRNVFLPRLGSGLLFDATVVAFLYLEAVLLAGAVRLLRRTYRTYRRGRANGSAR
ncbi:hypothetical protein [Halopelagius fulvigenes]|uniref:Uncharacterized protein n=1 Tax=Halopelagius fulvigenes TaxID=1198324 RepID=A0ABD5U1A9_9EURY